MRGSDNLHSRLFRQDGRIAVNAMRIALPGWYDRLIAAVMLLGALTTVRFWLVDRPWNIAAWVACGAAVLLGSGAARLIAARLDFHGFDGLLAADALNPQARRRYRAAWHGIALAVLTSITLFTRPSLLIGSVPGYLAGVLVARLMVRFRMPGALARKTQLGRTVQALLKEPSAGAAAAVILLLSLLPARALATNGLIAVAGIETMFLALALAIVDDGIVRFMTIAGHGTLHIIVRHGKSVAVFFALAVPGCWLILGPGVAGVVAAASFALLLLLIVRLFAYRLHGKRFADVLVSILAGLLIVTTYAAPIALPFVAIAMVWHLHRRGTAKTWLLT